MKRSIPLFALSLCAVLVTSQAEAASPRQSALNTTITDSSIAFGGGVGAGLNSATPAGTNGVLLNFDTDVSGGASDQVALEWETFGADLSGFSNFSVNINPGAGVGGAQLFVRSDNPASPGNTDFVSSGFNGVTTGIDNKLSVDLAGVAFPNNIVSYGIQIFTNGASLTGGTATLSTAPTVNVAEDVLFSWETGLDGWTEGFHPDHTHSLVSTGATDGAQALQIQRVHPDGTPSFRWGSQRTYDIDPDGDMIPDPAVVAEIADLGQRINAANAIAFDVTINDPIDLVDAGLGPDPTFAGFGLNITDGNSFYQTKQQFYNPVNPANPDTHTFIASLDSFVGQNGIANGLPLTDMGFKGDSSYASFTISTNTNGVGLYQIDNFRLISETTAISADFNLDSAVGAADLAQWQGAYGGNNDGDADFDADTDGGDFLFWQRQLSGAGPLGAIHAVPEPSSLLLLSLACVWRVSRRTRLA